MNMVLSDNKVIKNYDTLETGKKLYFSSFSFPVITNTFICSYKYAK